MEGQSLEEFKLNNNLNDEQLSTFQQMQKQVTEELDTNPGFQGQNRAKVCDMKHLLRLLKAREFKLNKAVEMWRNWIEWRKKYDVDNINIESIESELKTGKAFWHKYDKQGNPCCVVCIKKHIAADTTHDKIMRFMIYLMEVGIKMAEKSGTGKMCVLWDREGFSSKNMDLSFITLMKSLVSMFQDNYAERLAYIIILHPSFLMRQAFNIFRPLLADKVRQKIKILNDPNDLKNHFDENNLLQMHGGTSNFEYNYPNNILSDPLNAVQPYIQQENPQLQLKQSQQSFSFQNQYENENQELNSQSACYYSIDNDSTEFFNFQNSKIEDNDRSQSQSQSSKFQEFNHENNLQSGQSGESSPQNNYQSLNQDRNKDKYQEDYVFENQEINHIEQRPAPLLKYGNVAHEENQVISSGCCSCKSGSSCCIF